MRREDKQIFNRTAAILVGNLAPEVSDRKRRKLTRAMRPVVQEMAREVDRQIAESLSKVRFVFRHRPRLPQ